MGRSVRVLESKMKGSKESLRRLYDHLLLTARPWDEKGVESYPLKGSF
jgi:hypothetical protein